MSIAVQGAIGSSDGKATTALPGFNFNSMAMINGYAFGASINKGLCRLNTGTKYHTDTITHIFTLATTDFGIHNPKRLRFVYIGIDASVDPVIAVKTDDQEWREYPVELYKEGLQRVRVPIGHDGQGRYWTIKIYSNNFFNATILFKFFATTISKNFRKWKYSSEFFALQKPSCRL